VNRAPATDQPPSSRVWLGFSLSAAIVESVQRLSEAIGASLVAEGIETREDFEFVRAAGVRYAQDYFFSRSARGASRTAP